MMNNKVNKSWYSHFSFKNLSLQQRLILIISILLCSIIFSFGFASYFGLKTATVEIGKKRLRVVTDQLGTMFSQSTKTLSTLVLKVARQDTVETFMVSGGKNLRKETWEVLTKARRDSTWLLMELLDSQRKLLGWSGNRAIESKLSVHKIFSSLIPKDDSCEIGKIYAVGDSMYYPVVATVSIKNKVQGYLVCWRSLSSNRKGLAQLSELMGTGGSLYIGDSDRSLLSSFIQPVQGPPHRYSDSLIFTYKKSSGEKVYAAAQPILNTPWILLVEFTQHNVLEAATSYRDSIFIIGLILVLAGIFISWLISRNITKPLQELTAAAATIAAGDYSTPVIINRMDELGKLAKAFNRMAEQVHINHSDLENKVAERTSLLQLANKELESFTYSVSHDLRAPLRAIIGFTSILENEYTSKMDAEALRLTSIIKKNTQQMGDLIDDLLAFSRLGKNEIIKTLVNTDEMVKEVIKELGTNNNIIWNLHPLPEIKADMITIKQVWINLISNAIKYSRNNPHPRIEIGTGLDSGHACFFVKDNGAGFNQQYEYKLFKVFQRLHSMSDFEGTGVGLAIVEKIIIKHGGKVWAKAEVSKGACFYFTIPS